MNNEMPERLLTVVVLTLNESKRIERCLKSASFADEVIVIDSGSTDGTVSLARAMGAEVYEYPDWQGFAVQRNRGLKHAKGKYIFFLDADEVLSEEFIREISLLINSGENIVGRIKWRTVAFGVELKYLKSTSYVERLFLRRSLKGFDGVVHEKAQLINPDVKRFTLKSPVLHYSRENIKGSLEKMTQYAMLGAAKRMENGKQGGIGRGFLSAFNIFFRIYFIHRGMLCGRAGFLYAIFHALEAFFRYVALEFDKNHLQSDIKR